MTLDDPFHVNHYRHQARTLSNDLAKILELALGDDDRAAVRRAILWADLLEVSLNATPTRDSWPNKPHPSDLPRA